MLGLKNKRPIRLMELSIISRNVCDSVSIYYWICNLFQDVELDLVVLVGGGAKKKHAEKNRSTRFSNCANVEQKNGSQFIYKRCYIKLNDNRIKSISVASITPVQTTVHTWVPCVPSHRITDNKRSSKGSGTLLSYWKIPYLQVFNE